LNILFDLDGTLTDPGVGITRCLQHALARLGRDVPAAETLRRFVGPPLHETFAELLQTSDGGVVDAAVRFYRERYVETGMFENELEHLEARGTWMVGDRMQDVRGARENGVSSIAVRWGYGDADELREATPDHLATSMREVCRIIKGLTDFER
jgi:phosphoglycolate phosphatase-like HAD superfamily hydrolase